MDDKKEYQLKDPQTVRIFVSSPFNGMEEERNQLAKFYWPKLESLLNKWGLKLRLVDLRWGITTSSQTDYQTINICLHEVARSDIFVGLYGNRYGWHGTACKELQKNFEEARKSFPWTQKFKDKSVTELEYREGHLNKPGKIAACFCFRDKKYDEQKCQEAIEMGDSNKERFFKIENCKADRLLQSLKGEVKHTKGKTLGIMDNYNDPEKAARFIYNKVSSFVEENIVYVNKKLSEREERLLAHQRFIESRCGTCIGGEKYFNVLDQYLADKEGDAPLVILGGSGCGKSTILSNWTKKILAKSMDDIVIYHSVGCSPESSSRSNILLRLIENIHIGLGGEEHDFADELPDEKSLLAKFEYLLQESDGFKGPDAKKLVIIVDKMEKVPLSRKIKPLFWLPRSLPKYMKVIFTLSSEHGGSCQELRSVLEKKFRSKFVSIEPLNNEEKTILCKTILTENSKSMEEYQLEHIINSPKTNQPFFLNLLINELCLCGNFRNLDQLIESHLECNDAHGLLCKILRRISVDYSGSEYGDKMVEDILCALTLSTDGLSESEIPYPHHIWAPLIFALDKYLINRLGLLDFCFDEIKDAVTTLYMNTKEKLEAKTRDISDLLMETFKFDLDVGKSIDKRLVEEIANLLKKGQNKAKLAEFLGNIEVFLVLVSVSEYDLNEYWSFTGVRSDEIASIYITNLDPYIQKVHGKINFETTGDVKIRQNKIKVEIIELMVDWMGTMRLHHGLGILQDHLIEIEKEQKYPDSFVTTIRKIQLKFSKACILSATEKHEEALRLHKEVLEKRMTLYEANRLKVSDIAISYQCIGQCMYHLGQNEDAMMYYLNALESMKYDTKSNAVHKAGTYTNLGLVYLRLNQLSNAYSCFEKSNNMHEILSPESISLDVAFNLHNMAMVEKNRCNINEAEQLYLESLKIKEKLVGSDSYDVALTLMNIGTLNASKKDFEKCFEYNKSALDIMKKTALADFQALIMVKENIVSALTSLGRFKESEEFYEEIQKAEIGKEQFSVNRMPHIHRRMAVYYLTRRECEKAANICINLLQSSNPNPSDLAQLIMADGSIDASKRTDRPRETTFEYGLEKWPNQRDIIKAKIIYMLHREQQNFFTFVASFCEREEVKDLEGGGYILLIDIIQNELKDEQIAKKLVMLGLRLDPNSEILQNKMKELCKS